VPGNRPDNHDVQTGPAQPFDDVIELGVVEVVFHQHGHTFARDEESGLHFILRLVVSG
jgi:hypothetical protein